MYSRIFYSLGFILPFILKPKLIIQVLSRLGLLWDEEVPQDIKKDWNNWLHGINGVLNFEFPRCVVKNNTYKHVEMHIFTDSSRDAYAIAYYFVYDDNTVSIVFLSG